MGVDGAEVRKTNVLRIPVKHLGPGAETSKPASCETKRLLDQIYSILVWLPSRFSR